MEPLQELEDATIRHERIKADGVELHVAVVGGGPPVILLHGFPENCRIPDASHWVQNEAPDEVNRVLTTFLAGR